ncbi:MAG TPA: PHB depolymerase family esterase [Sphingobacteriaceae bacterium]|nr:PHB depolymerase family esterase [Sphingobacteriaceae bacterium]
MNITFFTTFLSFIFSFYPAFSQPETTPGLHSANVMHNGIERKYMYYIPGNYSQTSKSPVVFFLHGMGNNAQGAVNVLGSQYHARAERDNAIVVYPEAISKHWNDRLGRSYPLTDSIDDEGFISMLIDRFVNDFKGDKRRVYISGSSNGGMMAYRLSSVIPQKIAAMAPFISSISASMAREFTAAPPIPVIITNGTADPFIRWSGESVSSSLISGDDNVNYWKKRNRVKNMPRVTILPDICTEDKSTVEKHHFKGKYDVILYKIINGGHQHPTLPTGNAPATPGKNCDYNSFETVWDFMLSYKK